ncbi:hypothetical protein FOPE_10029 [Fonsecaea pedrosoi]|nr:hypothetical protein FOPE_10029 [Fonsecaea pedrosoi]
MSATASGSNARPNGSATSREHNQGNQERKWTPQQKAEVIRIRRCSPTAFYEILAVEKTASDGEIKKAYRKISLLTHPDKNGYEGADEAFKSEDQNISIVLKTAMLMMISGIASIPNPIRCREEVEI